MIKLIIVSESRLKLKDEPKLTFVQFFNQLLAKNEGKKMIDLMINFNNKIIK